MKLICPCRPFPRRAGTVPENPCVVTIMSMVIPTLRVGNDARKLIVVRAGFHLRGEGGRCRGSFTPRQLNFSHKLT